MKKIILSLFLFIAMAQTTFAAGIGYVDYVYIYKNSPIAKKYTAQLNAKAQEVRKYNSATKQLVDGQKTAEAKTKVKKDRQAGLVKLENDYINLKKQMDNTMRTKVKVASDAVLVQKKLDAIFDKRFLVTGGVDCTQEVFKAIK